MTTKTDDFNRANGALGANWTTYVGSGCTIVSNQVQANTHSASHGSYWNADSFGADQYSKVTVKGSLNPGAANTYLSVCARMTGTGGARDGYIFTVTADAFYLSRVDNGSSTDIDPGSGTFSSGDVIEIRCTGTTIEGYVNDSLVASATDANYSSGAPGFEVYNSSSSTLTPWDDWEGGDLGGSPDVEEALGGSATTSQAGTQAPVLSIGL